MTTSISAIGFEFEKKQSEIIEKKLTRISYAEDLIVDLIIHVKHEKEYNFDITFNFRWGAQGHVGSKDYDFTAALNKVMDSLDLKLKKEKDKIQERKK